MMWLASSCGALGVSTVMSRQVRGFTHPPDVPARGERGKCWVRCMVYYRDGPLPPVHVPENRRLLYDRQPCILDGWLR